MKQNKLEQCSADLLELIQSSSKIKTTQASPPNYLPNSRARESNGMVSGTRSAATSIRNDLLRFHDHCSVHELHDDVASLTPDYGRLKSIAVRNLDWVHKDI